MRLVGGLLLLLSPAVAFLPLQSVIQRRSLRLYGEFDHLLKEVSSSDGLSTSRRYIQVGDATILASVAAPPPTAPEEVMNEIESTMTEEDPYDDTEQFARVQQYQQRAHSPTMSDRLKQMDLQDIVLTLILPSIVVFAAGRWGYNRVAERLSEQTSSTLESFAKEMIYHDGDFEEMKLCVSDYSKKLVYLGPLRRDKMLKAYLADYAKRKTVSPQSISSLSYAFTLFKLDEKSAAEVLVSLCRDLGPDKISSAGKLLFFGSRILKSPEGLQALQPIKELIKSTYREASVAETMVDTSQQAIAEASYRNTVQAGGRKQKNLTGGWEVLGLDRATAQRIFDEEAKEGFVSARETMYGGQAAKYDKKGRRLDEEGKVADPDEAGDDEEDEPEGPVSNVYECSDCGYTLFVAPGRETKFYGTDFKCPECGATKDKFQARDDFGEE